MVGDRKIILIGRAVVSVRVKNSVAKSNSEYDYVCIKYCVRPLGMPKRLYYSKLLLGRMFFCFYKIAIRSIIREIIILFHSIKFENLSKIYFIVVTIVNEVKLI